ncbi:MAG: OmpH family outer membrane protein [Candidatus Binataceae bacterium]
MKHCLLFLAAVVAVAAATPALAEMKFAYVDVQRALSECNAGKKAKADLQGRLQTVEQRLQRQQEEVQSLKNEIEKKGMLMQEEQRNNMRDQYAEKLKNFERTFKDSREDLQRKDSEITGKIVRDIAQVIRTLGEKNGYTLVFEKSTVLWGAPGIDITDEVIRTYNAMNVKVGALGDDEQSRSASGASAGSFGSAAAQRSTISK